MRLAMILALVVLLPASAARAPTAPAPATGGRAVQIDAPPGYQRHDDAIPLRIGAEAPATQETAQALSGDPFVLLGRAGYIHRDTGEFRRAPGIRIELNTACGGWQPAVVLLETHADENGDFRIEFSGDYCPTLYLRIYSQNAAGMTVYDEDPWFWQSDGFRIEAGGTYDLGLIVPQDEESARHATLVSNLYRNRKLVWYLTTGEMGPLEPPLTVRPCGSWGQDGDIILMPEDWVWDDGRVAQLYADVWISRHFADSPGWEHYGTAWCPDQSGPEGAYWHGIGFWMADFITHRYTRYFADAAVHPYDFETPEQCVGTYVDPLRTAGFFAAVLRDIQDAAQDVHTDYGSTYVDALALGHDAVVEAIELSDAYTPFGFLQFLAWFHSEVGRDLWKTAMNCGYQIDDEPPGVITNVTSSHVVDVPSADATIELSWTHAADLLSGVRGYSVVVATRTVEPDTVQNVFPITVWTSQPLSPGRWYIMVRAVDVAGNWSPDHATLGPYVIADAGPSDLMPYAPAGWARPVVPRPTTGATSTTCVAPATLVGGAWTYLNAYGTNAGGGIDQTFGVQFLVDGADRGNPYGAGPVGALQDYWILNRSTHVSAGRHTIGAMHDVDGLVPEMNEANNGWAWQWVWSPATLTPGTVLDENPPPDPAGGRDEVPAAITTYDNCNGYRLGLSNDWQVVLLQEEDLEDDYELALYAPSTGPTDGFTLPLHASRRGPGHIDGILLSGASSVHDLGVLNRGRLEGEQDYTLSMLDPAALALEDTVTVVQAAGELAEARTLTYSVTSPWLTVTVTVQPPESHLRWFWFNDGFTGALEASDGTGETDATGRSVGTVELNEPLGTAALVVLRDPLEGTAPDTLTISVGPGRPDFEPCRPQSGWHAPIVPRPAADGTPQTAAAPDTLIGNAAATWFNLGLRNASPVPWTWDATHFLAASVYLDGELELRLNAATALGGGEVRALNPASARTVRGGRHVAAVLLDSSAWIAETDETNNAYGEQFCWSPLALAYGVPMTRPVPPDPYGGWTTLPADSSRWFNCDGLRLPVAAGRFGAAAAMPGDGCNVNVRLHEPLRGAKDGFKESLASSQWGAGQSDYVLVDFATAAPHPYDVGLVGFGGDLDCTVEAVSSTPLPEKAGSYGPFILPVGRLLNLHEIHLPVGRHSLRLTNLDGTVDWGLGLHAGGVAFQGKSATVDSALAYLGGPGGDELLEVDVQQDGWYAVAVWKVGAADLDLGGVYGLVVETVGTGVPGEDPALPRAGVVIDVRPNPFNPRTTLVVEMPRGGRAELGIFDLRGRRVRALLAADLAPGRHEVLWDGCDDRGQAVPTGAYLARLRTAAGSAPVRKLMLLR